MFNLFMPIFQIIGSLNNYKLTFHLADPLVLIFLIAISTIVFLPVRIKTIILIYSSDYHLESNQFFP